MGVYSAEFPEYLMAVLKRHKDVEDVELDLRATTQFSRSGSWSGYLA